MLQNFHCVVVYKAFHIRSVIEYKNNNHEIAIKSVNPP